MRLLPALAAFLTPLLLGPAYGRQPAEGAPQGNAATPAGRQGQGTQGVVGGVGGPRGRGPAAPTPRRADGSVILGSPSADGKGIWLPGRGGFTTIEVDGEIPFQPWARAVLDDRMKNQLEPHARCKASGGARQFMTPYGVEFVEIPDLERVYIFDIGGPHTYRTIYMDGRSHPIQPTPTNYGHSIGWWEGDTLVVDTIGYNVDFWMDRRGLPHTEQLHTIERFTRTDSNAIRYEITVDDPGAYTDKWTSGFTLGWNAGQELFEYVCQQANYADELMVGDLEKVDRSSQIIP